MVSMYLYYLYYLSMQTIVTCLNQLLHWSIMLWLPTSTFYPNSIGYAWNLITQSYVAIHGVCFVCKLFNSICWVCPVLNQVKASLHGQVSHTASKLRVPAWKQNENHFQSAIWKSVCLLFHQIPTCNQWNLNSFWDPLWILAQLVR